METLPKARQFERDIFRASKYLRDKDGKPVKEHVGVETVRSATCPTHKPPRGSAKSTQRFIGVTDKGWLFDCGVDGHVFIAEPA